MYCVDNGDFATEYCGHSMLFYVVLTPSIASIPMTPLLLQAFSSTVLTCNALGGPRLIISWYRENQLLLSGQIGDTSLTYDISNANITDIGDYTCVAVVNDRHINSTVINILGKYVMEIHTYVYKFYEILFA